MLPVLIVELLVNVTFGVQFGLINVKLAVGCGCCATTCVRDDGHPVTETIVTVYVPGVDTVIVSVVCPVGAHE